MPGFLIHINRTLPVGKCSYQDASSWKMFLSGRFQLLRKLEGQAISDFRLSIIDWRMKSLPFTYFIRKFSQIIAQIFTNYIFLFPLSPLSPLSLYLLNRSSKIDNRKSFSHFQTLLTSTFFTNLHA